MRLRGLLASGAMLLPLAGCGGADTATSSTTPPPRGGPLVVHRAGGEAGIDDQLRLDPGGTGVVRHNDQAPVRLRVADTRALRRALQAADFTAFEERYEPDTMVADGIDYELRYGGRTVRVQETAPDVPNELETLITEAGALIPVR